MRIDLHVHTTASDGQYTPEQVIDMASDKEIMILSITDHDTIDGIKRAVEKVKIDSLILIPGIELSAQDTEEIHILGYEFDWRNKELCDKCSEYQAARIERGKRIRDFLFNKGIDIDHNEVREYAKGGTLGRPHFALYLQEHRIVKSRKEAFDKYLDTAEFKEATNRRKPSLYEAISLIHRAGGRAVLAHPGIYRMNENELEKLIYHLKDKGIDGIECFYSRHTKEQILKYLALVKKYNLKTGCGSDFHGEKVKPDIMLGIDFDENQYGNILIISKEGKTQ